MTDTDIDDLFAIARDETLKPSAALMERVLTDGQALQPRAPSHHRAKIAPQPGFWSMLLSAIGGGGGLAGLTTATLAGLWIGFFQPSSVSAMTDVIWSEGAAVDLVELIPSYDDFLTEG
jgi:hypothetical protein